MNAAAAELNRDLARALGLPRGCTRAVLRLEVDELPKIEVEAFVRDGNGVLVLEPDPDEPMAKRIARVKFVLRLEPSKVE